MLSTPTLEKLKALKFYGMIRALEEQLAYPESESLSFDEKLEFLIDQETLERENRSMKTRLKQARLRQQACLEDLDYRQSRGLDKSLINSLSTCKWIKENLNILITGPCGAGKSYLACAFGHCACLKGYRVLYYRSSRLFADLAVAKGDGRYAKLMKTISKADLLIIDDWGLSVLPDQERTDLLEILEDRHGIYSTIVASQVPVDKWYETIGNPTLADAILDRLVHNAYKIVLKGGSMRKKKEQKL